MCSPLTITRLTIPLPHVDTKTGSRIMLIKQGAYDPNKISIIEIIKVLETTEICLYDSINYITQ